MSNEQEKVVIKPFFVIDFREMLSFGHIKYKDYDKVRPGAYTYEIGFLFIEISWGKI